ncbi:hypothetical protein K2173_017567 [Erythroxylum novogranatense]|uniref:Bidirectional sugar transporter SWEET n=1 Tax=Erythroxylum novogranatense TaxID=1862640 RepID=A0AAV8T7T9_9ROSI|nr:hypothetical protein K2173_017567 [Erythroxylum novogranatense]
MAFVTHEELAFVSGVIGNIIGFLLFLAPLPTFYTICKKKTSEGFQSIPYVVALTSAILILTYGLLKTNAILLVTINSVGSVIEITYLAIYLFYASKKQRILTLKLILINLGSYGLMMLITILLVKPSYRVSAVGWICAAFNLAVFAAPLSIMKRVITTKSVEYMPFSLSFFLTLSATTWFFYGFFTRDCFIAVPNVVGFLLGLAQIVLYLAYKNAKKDDEEKPPNGKGDTVEMIHTKANDNLHMEMNHYVCTCKHKKPNENNFE